MTFTEFLKAAVAFCIRGLKIVGIIILVIAISIIVYKIIAVQLKKKHVQERIVALARLLYDAHDSQKIDRAQEIVTEYESKHGKGLFNKISAPDNPTPDEEKQYKEYKAARQFLDALQGDLEIYSGHRMDVANQYAALEQKAQQAAAQSKQAALDKIQDDRAKATAEEEQAEKTAAVSRAIRELEKLVAVLQDTVDKNGRLERTDLRAMLRHIDTVEDNAAAIASADKNNLIRIQHNTLDMFKRITNEKDIRVNIDEVKAGLAKICKKR